MNICIIGQYPPQLGGVATYTKQLENKLVEKKKEFSNSMLSRENQETLHARVKEIIAQNLGTKLFTGVLTTYLMDCLIYKSQKM